MKYRHAFHAGNFADLHKHVTLLALLDALARKDKGFLYLDTHAGRGSYDLSTPSAEAAAGVGRFLAARPAAPALVRYAHLLTQFRAPPARRHLLPGSPLLAALALRPQDRAVLIEARRSEARALEQALAGAGAAGQVRIEHGDGFAKQRAALPPHERRGLILIDPPYEETQADFTRVRQALAEGLRRFPTGVFAAWYPIKEQRDTAAWLSGCSLPAPALVSELWLYPRDSRVALNGSGLLIANPPWQVKEHMQVWLPELLACLAGGAGADAADAAGAAGGAGAGTAVRMLSESSA